MSDYYRIYSRMNDDQLLNLATESSSLLPIARQALESELALRKLGAREIASYIKHLKSLDAEPSRAQPLSRTFHGCGTTTYGRSNFAPDGSFLTTQWLVICWFPIFPLKSIQVKNDSRIRGFHRRNYQIIQESSPNLRQVIGTYLYFALLIVGIWRLAPFRFSSQTVAPYRLLLFLSAWALLPWMLRTQSRLRG